MKLKNDNKNFKLEQEKEFREALLDDDYKALVKKLKITEEQAFKNTLKLKDTIEELHNCKNCKNLYNCQNKMHGYVYFPSVKESNLIFTYTPCKYQKQAFKMLDQRKTNNNILASAKMKDIKITKNRAEVIKWIKAYFDKYNPYEFSKGLYLHGNFGTGKTYLIAALFNEIKNSICTRIIKTFKRKFKFCWRYYL